MLVATHSGHFHADDVFAFALLRTFLDSDLRLVRTRDLDVIATADIAIDVGGEYDPARGRFDHHQREYTGELSSAGMVLSWLASEDKLSTELADKLRKGWVDYIDAVDNGRTKPESGVPCINSLVGSFSECAEGPEQFDTYYLRAVEMCQQALSGLLVSERKSQEARTAVLAAMRDAEARGSRVLELDRHYKWKRAYFDQGGATHPTDYLLFPDNDDWRIIAIPPEKDSFDKKRPLPASWAGLVDGALSKAAGVPGAKFCHKNLFIAVFETEASARQAITLWGLGTGEERRP